MRILYLACLIFVAALAPAAAAEPLRSPGLSYTTMGGRKAENPSHMHYKTISRAEEEEAAAAESEKEKQAEDAADRVWKKYKALAAGQYVEEPIQETKETKAAGTPPPDSALPAVEPAGGLASILSEYRKTKAQRSQMRTITITPPEAEKKEKKTLTTEDTESAEKKE